MTVAGPTSRCKGNTRARKHETVLLYLIGKEVPKRSVSDGQSLNGLSSTRGGRRKAPTRSTGSPESGGDPDLEAGGPKRIERQGASDTGNRIGKASTGRPSGLPVCRRPVTSAHDPSHPEREPCVAARFLSLPQGGWQFSPGSGDRAYGRLSAADTHPSPRDDSEQDHEHAKGGSCVCRYGIS